MARTQTELETTETTETTEITEAKGVNYTGTANLKQLVLAVANFEMPDSGINEWLQATKSDFRNASKKHSAC